MDFYLIDRLQDAIGPISVKSDLMEGYRGYTHLKSIVVLPVGLPNPEIQVVMYMDHSPCHPDNLMLVRQPIRYEFLLDLTPDQEIALLDVSYQNAAAGMKALIDQAHIDPAKLPRPFASLQGLV